MNRILSTLTVSTLLLNCGSLFAAPTAGDAATAPSPKACFRVHGMPGPEDLALNREKKLLYVSSHDRRNFEQTGKLYVIDLSKPDGELKPQELKINYPADFRPHGMSLVVQTAAGGRNAGKETLYVISHAGREGARHTIEVFESGKAGFSHVKTLTDPTLESPNDLMALADGRLFVSNDAAHGGKLGEFFDDALQRKTSQLAYFDGKAWSFLGEPVAKGNGIFHRRENGKEMLYRSEVFSKSLIKYELARTADGKAALKEVERIEVGGAPDNIEPDEAGHLYVAVHPSLFRFLQHVRNRENPSPSEIRRVDASTRQVTVAYTNPGEEIPAASTGIAFGKRLFISQVFEDFVLVCPRP